MRQHEKVADQMGFRASGGNAEQPLRGGIPIHDPQIRRVHHHNALLGLLEQGPVALFGQATLVAIRSFSIVATMQFFLGSLVEAARFLQHQDDHAHGDEQLQHGGNKERRHQQLRVALHKRA